MARPPESPLSRGRVLLLRVARIALAVVIGATLLLVIFEKHFIYFPSRNLEVTPRALGLPSEEVLLEVEPGATVHGWVIRSAGQPSRATVLFSHGNAGNIADRLDRILRFQDLPVDFFLYDYRGYGRSTGEPDEEGTYRDARAAYDYLVRERRIEPFRIVLMGESLGCAVSLQLALDRAAAGLILEAPFASIAHMAAAVYPFLPLGPLVRTRYDNLAKAARLRMPVFVTQGSRDEIIPVRQGRMVFEAAPEPRSFLSIEGAHHNDVYVVGGETYRRALFEFITRVTPPPA